MWRPLRKNIQLQGKVRLPPLERRWDLAEERMAITVCQRWIRGAMCRRQLWKTSGRNGVGIGATRAALRIQRMWRGRKGRHIAALRMCAREEDAVLRMTALYRGRVGRLRAQFFRVQEAEAAASYIQHVYRGRLGKKLYDLFRQDERRKRAQIMQCAWRRHQSRSCIAQRRDELTKIETWFSTFGVLKRRAHVFRLQYRSKHDTQLYDDKSWLWQALQTSTRAARVFEPFLLASYSTPLGSRRLQEKNAVFKLVLGFLFVADDFRDYSYATELLYIARHRYPDDINILYASAIAQHLSWSSFGSLEARRPQVLEEALTLARRAWTLEKRKHQKSSEWSLYLIAARRQRKPGPLCAVAVATQILQGYLYGDSLGVLRDATLATEDERRWQRALANTRGIFSRALTLADAFVQKDQIYTCFRVFEDLYATRPQLLPETSCVSRCRSLACLDQDVTTTVNSKNEWQLTLYKAGDMLLCSARGRQNADGSPINLREYIIHPSELVWLHKNTGDGHGGNGLPVHLVLTQLIVTRRGAEKEQLVLPGLERARSRRNEIRAERIAAGRLRRAFRGFDRRSFFRRLAFRVRQKDVQAARLAVRRAQTLLEILERHELIRRAQAALRGRAVRRYNVLLRSSILFMQCHFRSVLARARLAAEAKRRLEGAQVESIMSQGRLVSGRRLIVQIFHCGLNFKFIGHDLERRETYIGFVYQPLAMRILHHANLALTSPLARLNRIQPNQHLQVAQLLLERLAIVDTPTMPTAELKRHQLGARGTLIVIDHERSDPNIKVLARQYHDKDHFFAHPPLRRDDIGSTVGLLQKRALERYLSDTKPALVRHFKSIDDHRTQLAGRGLVPQDPQPTEQERANAALKFKMRVNGGGQPQQDEARRLLEKRRRLAYGGTGGKAPASTRRTPTRRVI